MNPPEDLVGFGISASAYPPSFDDTDVVSVHFDPWVRAILENSSDE